MSSNNNNEEENEWPTPVPHPNLSYIEAEPPLKGQTLYLGGEIGPDKNIYCIPGHSSRVLVIYPSNDDNDKCIQIGPGFSGKIKLLRGILACNDIICGLPCHADSILRIDARIKDDVKITTIPIPYDEYYHDNKRRNEKGKRNGLENIMAGQYHLLIIVFIVFHNLHRGCYDLIQKMNHCRLLGQIYLENINGMVD